MADSQIESSSGARPYGACPTQLEGIARGGRPFYFRSRGGDWTLWAGPRNASPDYLEWCDHEELIATGNDETYGFMASGDVDAIVTEHLGSGWVSTICFTQRYSIRNWP